MSVGGTTGESEVRIQRLMEQILALIKPLKNLGDDQFLLSTTNVENACGISM